MPAIIALVVLIILALGLNTLNEWEHEVRVRESDWGKRMQEEKVIQEQKVSISEDTPDHIAKRLVRVKCM